MSKVLGCKITNTSNTNELFNWIRKKYCFLDAEKQLPADKMVVAPYVIVTDGHDVFTPVGENKSIDIGMSMFIYKPNGYFGFKTERKFDSILQKTIIRNFLTVFKDTKVLEPDIKGKDRQSVSLAKRHIDLYKTDHAVKSLDGNEAMPIYFLMMPNDLTIQFPDVNEFTAFAPVTIGSLKHNISAIMRMTPVSKRVTTLLVRGELSIPERKFRGFKTGEIVL